MAQPSKPLKSGDFAVSVAEDPVLWTDRKRVLGLPLSFTRYSLTANKLVLNTGFMSLHEEDCIYGIFSPSALTAGLQQPAQQQQPRRAQPHGASDPRGLPGDRYQPGSAYR